MMLQYRCEECGARFLEPDTVPDILCRTPWICETIAVCPSCGSMDFEEYDIDEEDP